MKTTQNKNGAKVPTTRKKKSTKASSMFQMKDYSPIYFWIFGIKKNPSKIGNSILYKNGIRVFILTIQSLTIF
jgi:hypothetical protein